MTPTNTRLRSLDVFRGITIALMILVNSPGNSAAFACLAHSVWNGCTLADLVFPFFIFIVGVACVFSLSKARDSGLSTQQLLPKILKRSFLIFFIGLFLNAFPKHLTDFTNLRLLGVLQRIAICYLISALLFLNTTARIQLFIFIGILLSYWIIITGLSAPNYNEANNFAAYLDRLLLSPAHLYQKTFDPEGLLSTLPAIATALLGTITGIGLLSPTSKTKKLNRLIGTGIFFVLIGELLGLEFPINKTLWSSSYVLLSGGLALLVLAGCYWLIEMKGWTRWSKIFEIFGANALAVYFLHVFFLKIQVIVMIPGPNHSSQNLKLWLTETLFGWASLPTASLLYALSYTFFWLLILSILYRKKIFIKI